MCAINIKEGGMICDQTILEISMVMRPINLVWL
jgi:hypothetical protein